MKKEQEESKKVSQAIPDGRQRAGEEGKRKGYVYMHSTAEFLQLQEKLKPREKRRRKRKRRSERRKRNLDPLVLMVLDEMLFVVWLFSYMFKHYRRTRCKGKGERKGEGTRREKETPTILS